MFPSASSDVDAFLNSASMDMTATVSSNAALEQKIIREQFVVAPVTGPIVCLAKLLKAGWEFQRVDGVLHLCKDGHGFPLSCRKNSLYAEGVISKVSQVPSDGSASSSGAVRAIRLIEGTWKFGARLEQVDTRRFGNQIKLRHVR